MDTSPGADPAQVFFAAAARGELALRHCATCNEPAWPVAQFGTTLHACPYCLCAPLGWMRASGRGTLHSFAVVHQVYDEALASEVPYALAIVELAEGVRTQHVRLVDCPLDQLKVGMPVEVVFEEAGGLTIPKFRPV
ncbi:MAG: OB-fold domain-containing protein [Acidimicrobiaceae bacterium]|nr:OB-fold domain-containing protein [Acidimicrobiaceae bacterium]